MTTPNATTTEFSRRCRHCGEPLDPASSFCSKCGATAELPGGAGDSLRDSLQALFGRELEIQGVLGRGGMAAVYAAFDPALQRRVAVKVLLPDQAEEPGMANKFLQEARTVASLQHPHVVTVYGVRANDSTQAIVMQFVEGRSLDVVLKGRPRLPIPVAALILSQAASGLQHAHDRGIIHRDVKPGNVLLDHDGRAIVSDFGIARRDTAPRTTATGFVIGTWSYMSPEQRTGQSVTASTDQYAFGVMAFEVLTGDLPFKGTVQEVLIAHIDQPVPSLRERRPEIPASVEALVQRMMAKKPSERFPSLREAERAFRALVPDEGGTTQVIASYSHVQAAKGSAVFSAAKVPGLVGNSVGAAPSAVAELSAREAPTLAVAPAPSRSKPFIFSVAAVLLLTVGGVLWQRNRSAPSTPASMVAAAAPGGAAPPGQANPASPQSSGGGSKTGAAPVSQQPSGLAPVASGDAGRGTSNPVTGAGGANAAGNAPPPSPQTVAPAAPAPVVTPRVDSSAARASVSAPPAPDASSSVPAASVADARKIARDFVTMLNQQRSRELGAIPSTGGDAAMRAELLRLSQSATDFAAGFDRVASAPDRTKEGFTTDFVLDLEWRGGRKLMTVRALATMQSGSWRLAGWRAETPP